MVDDLECSLEVIWNSVLNDVIWPNDTKINKGN